MTRFERMSHKGSSKDNERIKLICDIRHQHTNYDRLVVFYSLYPRRRAELNSKIGKLIETGPEGILEFREDVKHIENWVNLNVKDSQKRFIEEQVYKLKETHPTYSNTTLKKLAKEKLAHYIRRNNEAIAKLKEN